MNKETITAVYTIKNESRDIKKFAESIAVGQTLGAWEELPGKLKSSISQHLAHVVSIEESEYSSTIKIAFPIINFGDDIGAMLTAIFGKISLVPKIKLEDIEFSEDYLKLFKGPRYGIDGIRNILNKPNEPLLMSIFKPCLGITTEMLGEMFLSQAEAGIDLVKDDEILYDKDLDSTLKRLEACLKAKDKANAKTIYAISLTGKANEILQRAKKLEENGANCFLFNYVAYGFPMLQALREETNIPIMAHPAFSGSMCHGAYSGLSEHLILGKLPRILGADIILFPSPYGSLAWEKEITQEIFNSHTKELPNIKKSFPSPSAGIKASMIPKIIHDFGKDVIINAGTAVWSHTDGGKAGALEFINSLAEANYICP